MPVITGNAANNDLPGTAAADTIDGGAGADTMTGLAGDDVYIVDNLGDVIVETNLPGAGIDTIRTSVLDALATYSLAWSPNVENLVYTGTLAAQLKGNGLANLISANSATSVNDTLYGGAGNDTLNGYGGNDSLFGGSGDDVIDGGAGVDFMIGGTGNDRYAVDSALDRVFEYAGGGFDTIVSAVAKDLRVPWGAQVEGLTYTGTTAATLAGNALGNLITSLSATTDALFGFDGDDTLNGGGGVDTMVGGLGNDFYFATATDVVTELVGQGTDTLIGGKIDLSVAAYATTVENLFYTSAVGASLLGNGLGNVMSGGAGNDTVSGGDGNDSLLGGAGVDSLVGGNGDDVLYGGGNPDYVWVPYRTLVPDTVADRLVGGAGNDRYLIDNTLDAVAELVSGGTLDVVISAIDNSLSRYANVEALVLQRDSDAWFGQGTAGNNILVGNERDNYLVGGAGNDTLSGFVDVANVLEPQSDALDAGDGDDVLLAFDYGTGYALNREISLFGGTGNDLYILGARVDSYGGLDAGGIDTAVMTSSGSIDNLEGVENVVLYGIDANVDASARAAINAVFGAANFGATYAGVIGNAYDATGNALANQIFGNNLNNKLVGGAGNDTIVGYTGDDTLEGGTGVDSLVGGVGDDWYYLDTGDVAVEAAGAGFDILASLTIKTFTGYANFEGLQFLGATAVNLTRGAGNTSADFLGGGSGNDTISGVGGNDTLDGGAGNDTVSGGDGSDSLRGGLGDDSVLGGNDGDTLDGGDGADILRGEGADDSLYGGAGNDALDGGANWDRLAGDDGNDSLFGGDGNDALFGEAGDDFLLGDANNDRLVGGAGSDVLYGGGVSVDGSNSGAGDHLWGGEQFGSGDGSADVFAFNAVGLDNAVVESFTGSGVYNFVAGATIGDFEVGSDTVAVAKEFVGDLDAVLDNVTVKNSAGGTFSSTSELVLVRANVADTFAYSATSFFDPISAPAVVAAIGNASAAIGINETRLFVVDDGTNSAVFLFQSNNGDATVGIDELYLLTVVTGETTLGGGDIGLF